MHPGEILMHCRRGREFLCLGGTFRKGGGKSESSSNMLSFRDLRKWLRQLMALLGRLLYVLQYSYKSSHLPALYNQRSSVIQDAIQHSYLLSVMSWATLNLLDIVVAAQLTKHLYQYYTSLFGQPQRSKTQNVAK